MRNNYEPELTYPVLVHGRFKELTAAQVESVRFNKLTPIQQLAERVTALEVKLRSMK